MNSAEACGFEKYKHVFPCSDSSVFNNSVNSTTLKILDLANAMKMTVVYVVVETMYDLMDDGNLGFYAKMSVLKHYSEDMSSMFGYNTTITRYDIKNDIDVSKRVKVSKVYECGPKELCIKLARLGRGFEDYLNSSVEDSCRQLYVNTFKESKRLLKFIGE
jgi:hypothetical protein